MIVPLYAIVLQRNIGIYSIAKSRGPLLAKHLLSSSFPGKWHFFGDVPSWNKPRFIKSHFSAGIVTVKTDLHALSQGSQGLNCHNCSGAQPEKFHAKKTTCITMDCPQHSVVCMRSVCCFFWLFVATPQKQKRNLSLLNILIFLTGFYIFLPFLGLTSVWFWYLWTLSESANGLSCSSVQWKSSPRVIIMFLCFLQSWPWKNS